MQSFISIIALIIIAGISLTTHSFAFTIPVSPTTICKNHRRHPPSSSHHHSNDRDPLITTNRYSSSSSENNDTSNNDETPNYFYYRPQSRPAPQGGPFAYTESNIRRSANTFLSIRSIGGVDCTNDVYARSPNRFEYWYIGKIARTDGTVGLEEAVSKCWNMMEEHAVRLRPVELGRDFGNLEIWVARGDSELEMSQAVSGGVNNNNNSYSVEDDWKRFSLKKMQRDVEGIDRVNLLEVGFMAEFVTNNGKGFYIIRNEKGQVMQ
jgi:hypothetical protein